MRKLMIITCMVAGCAAEQKKSPQATGSGWGEDTVRTMPAEDVKTVLPQAGQVTLVETYCVPCHSLKYIEMQPTMSYAAWEKIVDKMIRTYGAPVRDTEARRDIINYLFAIKGEG